MKHQLATQCKSLSPQKYVQFLDWLLAFLKIVGVLPKGRILAQLFM
jgi:hypothetical protein